jgi:hypothetical protein
MGDDRSDDLTDDDWVVRQVTGSASTRAYRCPGCDHEIRRATPHVVAWPVDWSTDGDRDEDAGLGERRHWHTACWRARHRRAPRTERSRNAPRH